MTKRYGAQVALAKVSFQAQPGEITALVGPNGSGKSTAMRCCLGLAMPDSGAATIDGLRYHQIPEPVLKVGACLDTDGAHPQMTARQHLRVICLAAGLELGKANEVLERVGLAEHANRRVKSFSLGMKQRLGLAAAILTDPQVLVLDEPQTGLDIDGVRWLRKLLQDFAGEGKTILVASHALTEIERIAHRVVFLGRGRVLLDAAMQDALRGYSNLEESYLDLTNRD